MIIIEIIIVIILYVFFAVLYYALMIKWNDWDDADIVIVASCWCWPISIPAAIGIWLGIIFYRKIKKYV